MPRKETETAKEKDCAGRVSGAAPIESAASHNGATIADPFDPRNLVLDQKFHETAGVKKLLTTVPVRKPNKQDFVRVHPDPEYRLASAALIELKEDRESYLVPPAMAASLPGEYAPSAIFTAINRQGVLHLWPVRLPGEDGKVMEWHRSAGEAAEKAMHRWVRVQANISLGAYEIFEAQGALPEPEWPDYSFPEILKVAFRNRLITDEDHPVIRRLRGFE
jgi:hypothetical protein